MRQFSAALVCVLAVAVLLVAGSAQAERIIPTNFAVSDEWSGDNDYASYMFTQTPVNMAYGTALDTDSGYNWLVSSDHQPTLWMDFGVSREFTAIGYGGRPGGGDRMDAMSLWISDSAPISTYVPVIADDLLSLTAAFGAPQETFSNGLNNNHQLQQYTFGASHTGRYVVVQFTGNTNNPGSTHPGADELRMDANPVPEPSTLILLVTGLLGLLAYAWRRRRA